MSHHSSPPTLNRRQFLRSASALIALPALEALSSKAAAATTAAKGAKNFVAIGSYLGWHQPAFFPTTAGKGYEMPTSLKPLEPFRNKFTVFSGLDHRAANGHTAWPNFLCGNTPGAYSLDQQLADQLGGKSRFASIELATGMGEGAKSMSFTKQGVGLPPILRPSVLYRQLFASQASRERTEYLIKSGQSSLDSVLDDAKRLQANLPQRDKEKLDEFFDSFRSVEKKMERQLVALDQPAKDPGYKLPSYDPITPNLQMEAGSIMYDLMTLAMDSGSTRVMSLFLDGLGQVFAIDGEVLKAGYHALSHHGNDPEMIRDLLAIERAHMECFAGFLRQLSEKKNPQGKSLLDDTVILLGTGMGDASRHSNANLPTLVAGGGFKHGQHLAIDAKAKDAPLLGDLYITLKQRLGVETNSFSNASRNLNHLFS
ncbi:DUF1552 domain-containing protein [Roseimicrobium sp. ORNL1]|uniref:DUF1552 domain-containing protein n=1 Tax=Roseimicrobium sp. ORNL1 TaxID=2711231 RepID=UPI0013E1BFF0|nr:DUF1552 domain-containing protein [Roseimicrobium sp. ORNL1]QIF00978.1 DUF1552 domain-containing protein [Roseimicrobium sp. ORNL1]